MKFVDLVVGLRVSETDEAIGLDASQHGETAYVFEGDSIHISAANAMLSVNNKETEDIPAELAFDTK